MGEQARWEYVIPSWPRQEGTAQWDTLHTLLSWTYTSGLALNSEDSLMEQEQQIKDCASETNRRAWKAKV